MRLILLAMLLWVFAASAAEAKGRVALVIGNPGYVGASGIGAAPGNADAIASALRHVRFDVTEVVDADQAAMLSAMEEFRTKLQSADFGLIYYCGYAVGDAGVNYLIPRDFEPLLGLGMTADLLFQGVSLDAFLAELEGSGALKAVVLDWHAVPNFSATAGFVPFAPRDGFVVLSLNSAPVASDAGGDSGLAQALLQRIEHPGVELAELFEGVRDDVQTATQLAVTPEIVAPPSGIPSFQLYSVLDLPSGGGGGVATEVPLGSSGADSEDGGVATGAPDVSGGSDCIIKELCPNSIPLDVPEYGAGGGSSGDEAGSGSDVTGAPPPSGSDSLGSAGGDIAGSPPPDGNSDYFNSDESSSSSSGSDQEDSQAGLPPETGGAPDSVTPGSAPGDVEIAPGGGDNPYVDMGTMSDADAWASVADSTDSARLQAYLSSFPNGQFADLVRYRLAQLAWLDSQNNLVKSLDGSGESSGSPGEVAQPTVPTGEEASPPPPPPPPPGPATVEVVRHPTLDAPEETVAGEEFTVTVALTEEQLTPDVTVRAGPNATVTPEGALSFDLPANKDQWPIDIDLLATGFDLTDGGAWSRRVTLYREGDSDIARFALKARAIRDPSKPRQLIARLYHEGEFLGSVSRPITVINGQSAKAPAEAAGAAPAAALMSAAAPAESQPLSSEIRLGADAEDVPDLDVTIHYFDPEKLGEGLIIIHSPHIGAPVSAEFTTPEGMGDWLNSEYLRLVGLGLKLRGATSLAAEPTSQDPETQKRFVMKVAEGFGTDLWRNYVPDPFKQVFWSLKAEGKLHSIQINSNSPVLPWELVDPQASDGTSDGFLGLNYRLARWAQRDSVGQLDRPLDRIAFTGVATVAPPYDHDHELPFQKVEVDALSKLTGFRLVDGDFGSFERMVGEVSTGFIHFSGHGEVNDPGTGSPVFAIRLLDQALDPTTWRALTFAPRDKGNPFFFFNACDTGQARSLGGFVQGWGPAILASGASGFIGGMWPLTDRTAADFSTGFYGEISNRLNGGPVYLAEVLQDVRKQFYATGDPTYLAYTFYGNANLRVVRE